LTLPQTLTQTLPQTKVTTTTTPLPITPMLTEPYEDIVKTKPGQGYNVYVKDRYIVKGKKKYQERFIRANKKPLTERDALWLGGTVVDKSAARSFKIKPAKGKTTKLSKPSINTSFWATLQNKFYKRKDVYMERTTHAIDSPGELQEITARGWIAQQRRMQPKAMKVIDMKDMRNILRGGKLF